MNRCGKARECSRCWIKDNQNGCPYTPNFVAREVKRIAEDKARYMLSMVGNALVEAAEKQIPMPLRRHAKLLVFPRSNNSLFGFPSKKYFCQRCNEEIVKFDGGEINFCPHCGQKLWWPKN